MAGLSIVMAGSSGFLGSHLRAELDRRGHRVTRLVRRPAAADDESTWDPYADELDPDLIAGADVVVNLAGAPTVGNPHSRKWARELRESRLRTTGLLSETIAAAARAGGAPAFVAANAVGWYGDHGPAVLTEDADTRGHSMMTALCRDWQAATGPAVAAGARVVVLRTAPVMDRRIAPLKQLRLLYLAGAGGRVGSGRQHMPMVSLRDWVAATSYLIEHRTASGPVNVCCTTTPTNAEFTDALAKALHRPSFATVPAPVLKVAAGPLSPELLSSMNLRPQALLDLGYEPADPDVIAVLASGLS
jgi:uncharacterized protein (TIGR01777 family)